MDEEIEILQSIYLDDIVRVDLKSEKPNLEVLIYPLDDEEDTKKNLRLNLTFYFTKDYPDEAPKFELKFVKGITDEDLETIRNEINEIAESNLGAPMLYTIIQHIKDKLSTFRVPKSCNCSICLYDFLEKTDDCVNLECYHYFHSECLIRHMIFMKEDIDKERAEAEKNKLAWKQRSISCPVCRSAMRADELEYLNKLRIKNNIALNSNTAGGGFEIVITDNMRSIQQKMRTLFEKQKNLGGIIDIDKKEEIIILTRPVEAAEPTAENEYELIANSLQNSL